MIDRETQIAAARATGAFLDSEHGKSLFVALERRYLDQIRHSESIDAASREHAYRMLRALDDLATEMRAAADIAKYDDIKRSGLTVIPANRETRSDSFTNRPINRN